MATKDTKPQSEKATDALLKRRIVGIGGWSVKMGMVHLCGFPDRLCLLPGGRIAFVELKSEGKKPTALQLHVHGKLRELGFRVEVIDTAEQVELFIKSLNNG